MVVRVRAMVAGPFGVVPAGSTCELPDDIATGLLAAGYAEVPVAVVPAPVLAPTVVDEESADDDFTDGDEETAHLDSAPESAVTRRGRPRGR